MKTKEKFVKFLREIHHKESLKAVIEFHKQNKFISWTDVTYPGTGDSILHIAAQLGKENIVDYVLNTWQPAKIDIKNNDCKTPLHEASQFSQANMVEFLLKNGADVNAIKRADWTALMLACTKKGDDALKTVTILLKNGANSDLVNKDGWNALHLASRTGDLSVVEILLKHNDKLIENITKNGRTLLHISSLHGHANITQLLIDSDRINVNVIDTSGNTPFHDAICSNNEEIAKLLVERGANIAQKNKIGVTALHLAAGEGLVKMIRFLVVLGMDIDILTYQNMAPIHYAARRNQIEAIKTLINFGAEHSLKDCHERTLEDYIHMNKHKDPK